MKSALFLVEAVVCHVFDVFEGREFQLEDRSLIELGIRKLVASASARAEYAEVLQCELEEKGLVEDTVSLLSTSDLQWQLAVESALTQCSDRELIIFGVNPMALMALAGYLFEADRLSDEALSLWYAAGQDLQADGDCGDSDGQANWCDEMACALIADFEAGDSRLEEVEQTDDLMGKSSGLDSGKALGDGAPPQLRRRHRSPNTGPKLISPFVWKWAYSLAQILLNVNASGRKYEASYFVPFLLRRLHDEKFAALHAVRLPEATRKDICDRRHQMCRVMEENLSDDTVEGLAVFIGADIEDHLICLGSCPLSGTTLSFLRAYYRINRAHKGLAVRKYRERSLREHKEDVAAWEAGDPPRSIASVRRHLITATSIHVSESTIISNEAANYERSLQWSHEMSRLVGSEIFSAIADSRGLYIWRGLELPAEFRDVEQFSQQISSALENDALLLYLPSAELFDSEEWQQAFERFTATVPLGEMLRPEIGGLFVLPCNIALEHFEEGEDRATIALFAGSRISPLHTERHYSEHIVQPYIHAYRRSTDHDALVLDKYYRQVVLELLRRSESEQEAWNILVNVSARLERACGRSEVLAGPIFEFGIV